MDVGYVLVASIASYKKVKVEGGVVSSGGRKHSSSSGECIGFMSLCFPVALRSSRRGVMKELELIWMLVMLVVLVVWSFGSGRRKGETF